LNSRKNLVKKNHLSHIATVLKTGKYRSSSKSTPSTKKKKTVNGVLQFLVVFNHKKNKKTFDLKTKTAQLNKFYEDVYNKS
jgi:hypothetical protein